MERKVTINRMTGIDSGRNSVGPQEANRESTSVTNDELYIITADGLRMTEAEYYEMIRNR